MKILSAALLSLLAALTVQAAVTVSTTTGHVYDVGKGFYSTDENVTDKSDSELCWAAAASNLIQHWQDYYYGKHDDGKTPPNGLNGNNYTSPTGTQYLAVFDAFRDNWEDAGGLAGYGFQWWFLGKDKVDADASDNLEENADSAGYYQGIFTGTTPCYVQQELLTAAERGNLSQEACFRRTMDAALGKAGQGVSLGIYIADENGEIGSGHAITCWGYETDADGKLSAIYITDSDDRYYGATKVRVEVDADGSLMLNSYDLASYNFNQKSKYFIGLMEYIDTPASIAQKSADLTSSITNGVVSSNTCLTEAYSGTGLSVTKEVIFSSTAGSITLTAPEEGNTGAGFTVEAGGMASLNGLTTLSATGFAGAGIDLKGYAYFTGAGTFVVKDNSGSGIFNTAYLELLNCADVSVTGNRQTDDNPDNEVLGGGIANHRTLSMIDCGTITLSGNTATGAVSAGGGMLSLAAVVEKNKKVIVTKNTVNGTELALGGGLYHFYINSISNNESVTITENAVSVQESAAEDRKLILQAIGGGLVQGAHSTEAPQTLLEENGTLTISNNTATANGTGGSKDSEIYALGGGLAVLSSENHPSVVSITGNTNVAISTNTVTATAEQGKALAFGGGAFVGSNSSLIIQGSEGHPQSVEIANNTASATYSGGGAIYSEGKVDISGNTSVSITGNQANGGSAVFNAGDFSLSGNGEVKVSGNQSGGNGAVYNGKDSTMEITWNGGVTFSENKYEAPLPGQEGATISGSDFDIVNSGNLYLAADEGKNITLSSLGLHSSGTTYLGCDAEGKTGAGTLVVQGANTVTSVFTPAQVAGSSKFVHCSVSYNSITALTDAENAPAPTAQGMTVTYSGTEAYSIQGMALQDFAYVASGGADLALTDTQVDSSCSFSVGSGTITLNNVEVLWTIPEGYTTGLTYTLDLSTLFRCTVTGDLSITLPGADTDDLFNAGYRYININFGEANVDSLGSVSVNNLKIVGGSGSTSVYYIPEPATSLLTLLALVLPVLRRRRR
ncbi:MAG: IdeS/Mac family cysteine endopeptidase, partial [Akkermansia muciniphila]|nr:IdeS/Mac family cysteine endopeptidase [Akkermansia muciniphila]